ncbi:MAG: hypothetical protein ACRERR_10330 [Moraxellaceae bacterium]
MQNTLMRIIVRLFLLGALCLPGISAALQSLDDEEMSGMTGEGMAFVWTDFRMMFSPDSYLEQMGSPSNNTCTSTGNTAGNKNCIRRADLRWFGLNVSGADTANVATAYRGAYGNTSTSLTAGAWNTSWTTTSGNMTQCAQAGIGGLGCPRGGPIQNFAAADNPYVLRVNSYDGNGAASNVIGNGIATYQGYTGAGDWDPNAATATTSLNTVGSKQTVLEFTAPASATFSSHRQAQDDYRFSFWGEIESGRGVAGTKTLKSQTLIQGNAAGSAMRFFKFTQTATSPGLTAAYNPTSGLSGCALGSAQGATSDPGCSTATTGSPYNNRTLAIAYDSYLHGDFRFNVAQMSAGASDTAGVAVDFNSTEGMYFRGSDVHLSLGQLFYQALTINMPRSTSTNAPVQDGNFTLEIPVIPNIKPVYRRFYSLTNVTGGLDGIGTCSTSNAAAPNCIDDGYATARASLLYNFGVRGATGVSAFMPARTAVGITNYAQPDANYAKTHGYARWGDWSVCEGVGCALPITANTAAQAFAGTGRNSWDSSGDGVFFVGTTDFNAYAYSVDNTDTNMSTNARNTYTTISYYQTANAAACTPANATAYATCGFGGARSTQTIGGSAATKTVTNSRVHTYGATQDPKVTTAEDFPAENYFLNSAAQGLSTTTTGANSGTTRNVISVPTGTALNIGDARIEGIQLNYLRFTSYGALN